MVTELPVLECASIMVVVSGNVQCQERRANEKNKCDNWENATTQVAGRGDIYYIPPDHQVRITNLSNEEVLAYRTFSYEVGPDHSKRIKHATVNKLARVIQEPIQEPVHDPLHDRSSIINSARFVDTTMEMDGCI